MRYELGSQLAPSILAHLTVRATFDLGECVGPKSRAGSWTRGALCTGALSTFDGALSTFDLGLRQRQHFALLPRISLKLRF